MNIHRPIGYIFSGFCALLFVWHLMTPHNPHHNIAIIVFLPWSVMYLVSSFVSVKVSRYLQPFTLLLGAFVTVYADNFPVAAIISVIATLIYWTYGGFRQLDFTRASLTFLTVFLMFFFGVVLSGHGYAPAYGTAIVYTILASVGFAILWMVIIFFASDIVQQNRDLLELTKKLSKGDCADVASKRK